MQIHAARSVRGSSYALADTSSGKIASAKNPSESARPFRFRAAFTEPPIAAGKLPPARDRTFPGGGTVLSDDPNADEMLSRELGRPVTILSSAPEHASCQEY